MACGCIKHSSNLFGLALFPDPIHRGAWRGHQSDPQGAANEKANKNSIRASLRHRSQPCVGARAGQDSRRAQFAGTISDYSPSTVAGGPYEFRGDWTLDVGTSTGIANFSASLNMETSDYGISSSAQVDPTNPATRSPHTHHIHVTNAAVSYDTSVCPANSPATTGAGVVVTGPVSISGNGAPASFESKVQRRCRSASSVDPTSSIRTLRWCSPGRQLDISDRRRFTASSERCQRSSPVFDWGGELLSIHTGTAMKIFVIFWLGLSVAPVSLQRCALQRCRD